MAVKQQPAGSTSRYRVPDGDQGKRPGLPMREKRRPMLRGGGRPSGRIHLYVADTIKETNFGSGKTIRGSRGQRVYGDGETTGRPPSIKAEQCHVDQSGGGGLPGD